VVDLHTLKVVPTFPVQNCSPAGLTMGPHHRALIGCSASFGTSPNVPTQSVVIDIKSGKVVKNIPKSAETTRYGTTVAATTFIWRHT